MNRERRELLGSEEGGGVGQKGHPSREPRCFPDSQTITLNKIKAWGSAPQTGPVILGGSLTHSEQHKTRGLLRASRAYDFENARTLSIRTLPKRGTGKPQGKKNVKEHASSQQISTKQVGFGFTTMSSLWPSMVCSCSVISRGIWVLEGGTSVCTLQRQGKRHVAKQGSLLEQSWRWLGHRTNC